MQRLQLLFIYNLLYIYWHSSWYSRSQWVKLRHIHVEEQTEKTHKRQALVVTSALCQRVETEGGGDRGGWRQGGVETPSVNQLCRWTEVQTAQRISVCWSKPGSIEGLSFGLNEYFIISFLHDLTSQDFNVSEWSKNHVYFTVTLNIS